MLDGAQAQHPSNTGSCADGGASSGSGVAMNGASVAGAAGSAGTAPAAARAITMGPLTMRMSKSHEIDWNKGFQTALSLDDFWIESGGPSCHLFLRPHGDVKAFLATQGLLQGQHNQAALKRAVAEGGIRIADNINHISMKSEWWTVGRLHGAGFISVEIVGMALIDRTYYGRRTWCHEANGFFEGPENFWPYAKRTWEWRLDLCLRLPAALFQAGPDVRGPYSSPSTRHSAKPAAGALPHDAVLAALHPPLPPLDEAGANALELFEALHKLRLVQTPKGHGPDDGHRQMQRGFRERILRIAEPVDWTAEEPDPEGLRCILYPYQRRALAWMLWRERRGFESAAGMPMAPKARGRKAAGSSRPGASSKSADHRGASHGSNGAGSGANTAANGRQAAAVNGKPAAAVPAAGDAAEGDHEAAGDAKPQQSQLQALDAAPWPCWRQLQDPANGITYFLNPATGAVRQSPPEVTPPSVAGGLLCEEMGLGKTVEMIALMLARPRPPLPARTKAVQVVSPEVGATSSALSFKCMGWGGTLVVSPTPIHGQWLSELQQHSGLRVEVYYGLTWHRAAGTGPSRNRQTPQDQWEALKHLVAGNAPLAFNADGEAAAIVARLMAADVVLTAYQVLQLEVNYSDPDGDGMGMQYARKLRHPKKYRVPVSPLLAVPWWRVAFDEAQMVAMETREVTRMANRIRAAHRWAVTGTPLGPHCLSDLFGLLQVVDSPAWRLDRTWKQCVELPLFVDDDAEALNAVVRPLMWRNTKALVALEGTTLPPRTLQEVRLHFTPAEASFYSTIRDDGRNARNKLQALLLKGGFTEQKERTARNRAEVEARRVMEQLRLACLHPQMTQYWRGLAADLQLTQGGTLSMAEIMGRMAEQKQGAVQAAERKLCERLNELAAALTAQADTADAARGLPVTPRSVPAKRAAPSAGDDPDGNVSDPGPSTARRRKRKGAAAEAEPASPRSPAAKKRKLLSEADATAARAEALQALTTARRVTEKGIDAFDTSRELESLPEPAPAAGASINAWRLIEVNTAHQLQLAHSLAGRKAEAAAMAELVERKMADITQAADEKLAKAQSRLAERERQSSQSQAAVSEAWARAETLGVERALLRLAQPPGEWLEAATSGFQEAQAREVEQRETLETRAGNTHVALLGTQVEQFVTAANKPLEAPARSLDAALHAPHLDAAAVDVSRVVSALSKRPRQEDADESWAGAAAGGPQGIAPAPPPLPAGKKSWQDYLVELTLQYKITGPEGSVMLAQRIRAACDPMITDQILRGVQTQQRTLLRQAQAQASTAAAFFRDTCGAAISAAETPAEQVGAAAAVYASRQAALRALRELHRAQLQVEVESEAQAAVMAEARLAAAGGSEEAATRHKPEFLRKEVAKAAEDARKLASERRYIEARRDEADGIAASGSPPTLQHAHPRSPPRPQPQKQQPAEAAHTAAAMERAVDSPKGASAAQPDANMADAAAAASPLALQLPDTPGPQSPTAASPEEAGPGSSAAATSQRELSLPQLPEVAAAASTVFVKTERHVAFRSPSAPASRDETAPMQDTPGMQPTLHPPAGTAAASVAHAAGPGLGSSAQGRPLQLGDLMQLQPAPAAAAAAAAGSGAAERQQPEASHAAAEAGQCPICLEDLAGLTLHVYPCGHTFCDACSTKVFASHAAAVHAGDRASLKVGCPLCKQPVRWDSIFRAASAVRVAPGQPGAIVQDTDPDDPNMMDVKLRGAWMTKLEAALRRVLRGRVIHPGDKWLVFSAFPDALTMLAKALAANGVNAVHLKGNREAIAKAIAAFNGDPEVAVMLMPAKTAAAGLTLTAANRVILLEPAADPAIPQQAVARVHRVGQIKPVTVYQLLIADTVEEPLWRMQQDRQHLFGGEQGAEEDEGRGAVSTSELPPPPANPQALRPEDLQRLLESIMDLDDVAARNGGNDGDDAAHGVAGAAAALADGAQGTADAAGRRAGALADLMVQARRSSDVRSGGYRSGSDGSGAAADGTAATPAGGSGRAADAAAGPSGQAAGSSDGGSSGRTDGRYSVDDSDPIGWYDGEYQKRNWSDVECQHSSDDTDDTDSGDRDGAGDAVSGGGGGPSGAAAAAIGAAAAAAGSKSGGNADGVIDLCSDTSSDNGAALPD